MVVIDGISSDLDPHRILASLGYGNASDIQPVSGGWDTAIWRFTTPDGRSHVLRVYRSPDRAPAAGRERIALQAANAERLPAPPVETHGSWDGRPVVVLGWCRGEPLTQYLPRRPWQAWRHARQFGQLQARIHALPVPKGLREGAPGYWLVRAGGGVDLDLTYLERVRLRTDTFVHMDFHPLNVLTDGRSITGVVDWTNAAAGDARADLAWTMTLLRVGPMPPHPLNPVLRWFRWLFYLGWRRGYESQAGLMPDLSPFLLWAGNVMLREVLPRIDDPQVWARAKDFEPLRGWIRRWEKRAGFTKAQ